MPTRFLARLVRNRVTIIMSPAVIAACTDLCDSGKGGLSPAANGCGPNPPPCDILPRAMVGITTEMFVIFLIF